MQTRRHMLKLTGLALAAGGMSSNGFSKGLETWADKEDRSAFDPDSGTWNISWPGKIAQYDLVYKSPPADPLQGIPLGNGEIGALFWCEESRLIVAVNKSDLWDDADFTEFHNWSPREEDLSTTLRHACRIILDFKLPVFSTLFLTDFNARLHLPDGSLSLSADSPYGHVELQAFIDRDTGLLFLELSTGFTEDISCEIAIERFGSRTFSHWYSQVNRDASIGTSGTEAYADPDGMYLTQELNNGIFAVGASVMKGTGDGISCFREHSRRAVMRMPGRRQSAAQLIFMVSDPERADALPAVKEALRGIRNKGTEIFRASNRERWRALWERSFVDYGDDYLNNLWYLTMYYSAASQGGRYPGRFNNGLWSWSRDVQNWNFYFHWNQQQLYWHLNAAGHHDLVAPYLNFRFNSLPAAKADARKLFHSEGAFISDVTERRGYNSAGEAGNHTPVAEIALDFWRQYQFTGDKNFLNKQALPFMIEASRFFRSLLKKGEDGLYHVAEGTGYEGWIGLRDPLTDRVYTEALLSVTLKALGEAGEKLPEAENWKEILENLPPLPVVKAGEASVGEVNGKFRLKRGKLNGQEVPADKIFAAGWGVKEGRWLTVFNPADPGKFEDFDLLDGIFPTVTSSPVFPSGLIGLADKDRRRERFDVMRTTALLYPKGVTGWDPVPVVLARLGLSEALAQVLTRFPERWQIYCNGWGHWGMEGEINKDAEWFFRTNQVRDVAAKDKTEKFPLPMWPFRHMSMESMSVLAAAMNESLLQSHDGIIRIAPAFPDNRSCRFTLHAVGGFVVSAEVDLGVVKWVHIRSRLGNPCMVQSPWKKPGVISAGKRVKYVSEGNVVKFDTKPGEGIFISPEEGNGRNRQLIRQEVSQNQQAKFHSSGKAQLGLPRMF